jgi:hypothetical protein
MNLTISSIEATGEIVSILIPFVQVKGSEVIALPWHITLAREPRGPRARNNNASPSLRRFDRFVGRRGETRDSKIFAQLLRHPKVILHLMTQPNFCRSSERLRESHRHFRRDAGATIDDRGKLFATNPKTPAPAAVTVKPSGLRQSSLMISPGSGGLCILFDIAIYRSSLRRTSNLHRAVR